jgi:hypothetical protein
MKTNGLNGLTLIFMCAVLAACGSGSSSPTDSDGDGIVDVEDIFPQDKSESKDTDLDGVGDNGDNCPAIANADQLNLDDDELGNACDNDIDGDGVLNDADAFPLNALEAKDTDSDTIGDNTDNCPIIANTDQVNTDGDSAGDACDDLPNDASDTKDFDGDLIGNTLDPDDDNDFHNDDVDAFPFDATEWEDDDGDQIGNNKDLHVTDTHPNAMQLQRLLDTNKAIKFISPQQEGVYTYAGPIGQRVRNAGDVNNDGLDDLLIGYSAFTENNIYATGKVYLLFGKDTGWPSTIDLGDLANAGVNYVEFSADQNDPDGSGLGADVASVGDVNGDQIDDFLISAKYMDTESGDPGGGEAFLVFGRDNDWPDAQVSMALLKSKYAISYRGEQRYGILGNLTISVGDVNNDTHPDFVIGEEQYNITDGGQEGRSILLFGGPHLQPPQNGNPVQTLLSEIPSAQRVFINRYANSITAIKDINADNIDDLAFGRLHIDNGQGDAIVLLGRASWPDTIDLDAITAGTGFKLLSSENPDRDFRQQIGTSISSGDLNGDGHADLAIASPVNNGSTQYEVPSNKTYILWGGRAVWPSILYADQLAADVGATISTDQSMTVGQSMAVLPDSNQDGMDELLLGAPINAYNSASNLDGFIATIFKINGREIWDNLVLSFTEAPEAYERIISLNPLDEAGKNVSVVGDYNQDGLSEFIIDILKPVETYEGQPAAEQLEQFYLIYGYSSLPQPNTSAAQ